MAKAKQQKFDFMQTCERHTHGGSLSLGKRKSSRPISTTRVMHLVLKSSKDNPINKGKKCSLLNPTNHAITKIIYEQAYKYKVKILGEIILNHSHAHIAIKVPSRGAYKSFIRTLSARIVKYLSKITKRNLKGFFDLLPFTRVLNKGENPIHLKNYFDDNAQEARGLLDRKKKQSLPNSHFSCNSKLPTSGPKKILSKTSPFLDDPKASPPAA